MLRQIISNPWFSPTEQAKLLCGLRNRTPIVADVCGIKYLNHIEILLNLHYLLLLRQYISALASCYIGTTLILL